MLYSGTLLYEDLETIKITWLYQAKQSIKKREEKKNNERKKIMKEKKEKKKKGSSKNTLLY